MTYVKTLANKCAWRGTDKVNDEKIFFGWAAQRKQVPGLVQTSLSVAILELIRMNGYYIPRERVFTLYTCCVLHPQTVFTGVSLQSMHFISKYE